MGRVRGVASMGPRHFSRGIIKVILMYAFHYSLQWGRGISAAELLKNIKVGGMNVKASIGPRHFSRGILH